MNENFSLIVMCIFLLASLAFLAEQLTVLPLARRRACTGVRARRSALGVLARLGRALALLLALDDVDDQPHDLLGAGRLRLAVGERLDPVGDLAFAWPSR